MPVRAFSSDSNSATTLTVLIEVTGHLLSFAWVRISGSAMRAELFRSLRPRDLSARSFERIFKTRECNLVHVSVRRTGGDLLLA
jgi:hypothetical protein